MRMRKTYYGTVAFVVTGSPVPSLGYGGWAKLHHAEWHICPDKHMPMPATTYERVNKLGKIRHLRVLMRCTGT